MRTLKNKKNIIIDAVGILIMVIIALQSALALSQKLPIILVVGGLVLVLHDVSEDKKKIMMILGMFLIMSGILTADYRDNILVSFDNNLSELQVNSEDLIEAPLIADYYGIKSEDSTLNKYGLASFKSDINSDVNNDGVLSDDELARSEYAPYTSQYGFQGKLARAMAQVINYDTVEGLLHLFYSLCLACVIAGIVLLLRYKYNKTMAIVFFIVCALSQWISALGRNLYWMEFLWFLPLLISLFCSIKIDDVKCRWLSYILVLVTICVKSLCGYEYISSVMLACIVFLVADGVKYLVQRDNKWKLYLRTTVIVGVCALLGFWIAISMHAMYRGYGNYIDGIVRIFNEDVVRRTVGFDTTSIPSPSDPEAYAMIASVWETLGRYFVFSTYIIQGIDGNLFPALCLVSVALLFIDIVMKQCNIEELILYIMTFLVPVSWYVLAKQHSYVHIHNNYVLWYLGYVQMCFYVIVSRIIRYIKGVRINKIDNQ